MSKNILLIEDDELTRQTVFDILDSAGYSVITAKDGDDGLEKLQHNDVDLIITDILMPNKEGIETIMEVRRDNPTTQIIAISGGDRSGQNVFLPMAKKLGATSTLSKPFGADQLLEAVAGAFE